MRHLILIRHAEAVSIASGLPDIQRPLSSHGQAQARLMGEWLRYAGLKPDRIVCSHSARTTATARIMARALDMDASAITEDPRIYLQPASNLIPLIHALPDDYRRVFVIGHNPDISALIGELSGEILDEQPPCTVASLTFPSDSWAYVGEGNGGLDFCIHPDRYQLSPWWPGANRVSNTVNPPHRA